MQVKARIWLWRGRSVQYTASSSLLLSRLECLGSYGVLGGGLFLMSEVPLYAILMQDFTHAKLKLLGQGEGAAGAGVCDAQGRYPFFMYFTDLCVILTCVSYHTNVSICCAVSYVHVHALYRKPYVYHTVNYTSMSLC